MSYDELFGTRNVNTTNASILMKGLDVNTLTDKMRSNGMLPQIKPLQPGLYGYVYPWGVVREDMTSIPDFRRISETVPIVTECIRIIRDSVKSSDWHIISKSGKESYAQEVEDKIKYPDTNDPNLMFKNALDYILNDELMLGSGVGVKIFNSKETNPDYLYLKSVDSSTFTKNPDMHNSYESRAKFIPKKNSFYVSSYSYNIAANNNLRSSDVSQVEDSYNNYMRNIPAYFQYSAYGYVFPISVYGSNEVVWLENARRSYNVYPISPIRTLWGIIQAIYFSNLAQLEYYVNNMVPAGILTFAGLNGGDISKEEIRLFMDEMRQKMVYADSSGDVRSHKGKVMGVNADIKFVPIQLMDLLPLERDEFWQSLVMATYGIFPSIGGYAKTASLAFSRNERRLFNEMTMQSYFGQIIDLLNFSIIPEYDKNHDLTAEYVNNDMSFMLEQAQLRQINIGSGVRSADECRKEDRMPPLPKPEPEFPPGVFEGQKPQEGQSSDGADSFMEEFNRQMNASSEKTDNSMQTDTFKSFYDELEYNQN